MNWSPGFVALGCPPTVTTTSSVSAACAGVVALIWVALTTLTPVAGLPPTLTVAGPVSKLVPVMVTAVPPAVGPELGLTAVTVGGGTAYVNTSPGLVVVDWPLAVTTTAAAA